ASLRHRGDGSYAVAEHVENATIVQQLPPPDPVAGNCEGMPANTVVVEDASKKVDAEKVEEDRLMPEPARPASIHISASSPKDEGTQASAPGPIPSDVESEASEEGAVGQMPEGRPTSVANGPALQYLRNRRLRLDFEVHGAGPSGVSMVEIWYTRDGRRWTK